LAVVADPLGTLAPLPIEEGLDGCEDMLELGEVSWSHPLGKLLHAHQANKPNNSSYL
jgi:hypothetical protein